MAATTKPDKILVACPHCGHPQMEPRTGISTVCRKCSRNYEIHPALHPPKKSTAPPPAKRHITCFDCGAELEVPLSAQSTMCKRCSLYIDLKDYHINNAVSKNFKTKGAFVVEPAGYVFNTEVLVTDAVIKGRFLGKLTAGGSLTIYSTAQIKGTFKTNLLIIPAANQFRWQDPIRVASAEIAGNLAADLQVDGTMTVKSTGCLFGDLEAASLVVEDGAVLVGNLRIGVKPQVQPVAKQVVKPMAEPMAEPVVKPVVEKSKKPQKTKGDETQIFPALRDKLKRV